MNKPMNRDVFLSLLAMDSYNRGYGQRLLLNPGDSLIGQNEAGREIGKAKIIDIPLPEGAIAAGFYAIAYDWNGETIISYRGTDSAPCGVNDNPSVALGIAA